MGVAVFDPDDQQAAGVENRRQGREPGFVVVLRPVEAQQRKRKMALQQFGGPAFPFGEKWVDGVQVLRSNQPQKKLGGAGGEPARASNSAIVVLRRENA